MINRSITIILSLLLGFALNAQEITYGEYMQRALKGNAALAAQSMNIEIADAEVKSSRTYNDPTIAIAYGNNEDWNTKLGESITAELSRTFTFGVRKAGIVLAQQEREMTAAVVQEYLRNFQADATIAYLSHLKAIALKENLAENYDNLREISTSDSLRHISGEISESEWIHSRLECAVAKNRVIAAEAAIEESAIALGYYMGNCAGASTLRGKGSLVINPELKEPDTYIAEALGRRADLLAAMANSDVAEAMQKMNSRNRRTDISLNIGAEHNIAGDNSQKFTKYFIGAAMPIKFSNMNKGAREADRLRVEQAQKEELNTRLIVQTEVLQAVGNYKAADRQVRTFDGNILAEAKSLLAGKRKAYLLGEISLLELIEIQQTVNLMHTEYTEALYNKAVRWVELQRSVGCDAKF